MLDKWYEVESSNVSAVRYDPNDLRLDVRFVTGKVYRHVGVKPRTVTEMLWGDSAGKIYHAKIRDMFPAVLLPETGPATAPKKAKPKRVTNTSKTKRTAGIVIK